LFDLTNRLVAVIVMVSNRLWSDHFATQIS
jgi:hypothetical protein